MKFEVFLSFYENLKSGLFFPPWNIYSHGGFGDPLHQFEPSFGYYFQSLFFFILRSPRAALLLNHLFALASFAIPLFLKKDHISSKAKATIVFLFLAHPLVFQILFYESSPNLLWGYSSLVALYFLAQDEESKKKIQSINVSQIAAFFYFLVAILASPPSLLFLLGYFVFVKRKFKITFFLALGVSAFYWIPFLIDIKNISHPLRIFNYLPTSLAGLSSAIIFLMLYSFRKHRKTLIRAVSISSVLACAGLFPLLPMTRYGEYSEEKNFVALKNDFSKNKTTTTSFARLPEITKGRGELECSQTGSVQFKCDAMIIKDSTLSLRQNFYPSWEIQIQDNDERIKKLFYENVEQGTVDVDLSPGKQALIIKLGDTKARCFAKILSAFSLVVAVCFLFQNQILKAKTFFPKRP